MAYSSSNVLFKDYHGRQANRAKEPLCKSRNINGIKGLKETSPWLLAGRAHWHNQPLAVLLFLLTPSYGAFSCRSRSWQELSNFLSRPAKAGLGFLSCSYPALAFRSRCSLGRRAGLFPFALRGWTVEDLEFFGAPAFAARRPDY
jgi:hypothetical protein